MASGDRPTVIGEGKHVRLVKRDDWEYASRKGVTGIVVIVAVTDEGNILLVEQPRIPVDANVIELPAGLAGDGGNRHETAEAAARRELLEETGYDAAALEYLGGGTVSAGISDELMTVFRATGLRKVGEPSEPGESITVHEVPLATVATWLADRQSAGSLIDLKIYMGLWFASQPRSG
jgi:ADP-ribose pyrophosphatase